eukprot:PhM_4_TR12498/c0_g1_i1/m.28478
MQFDYNPHNGHHHHHHPQHMGNDVSPYYTHTPPFMQPSPNMRGGGNNNYGSSPAASQMTPSQVQHMQQQFYNNMGFSPATPNGKGTAATMMQPSTPTATAIAGTPGTTPQHGHNPHAAAFHPPPPGGLLPKPVPIDALRGRIVDLAREDTGCRMLLRILENPTANDVAVMHSEVVESRAVGSLMAGRHSNFVMQRLFEVSTHDQVTQMLTLLVPDIAAMSCNPKGTFAMRKVVDSVTTSQQARLMINGLMLDPVMTVTDTNASQVLRRILKKVHANEWGSDILRPVINFVVEHICDIGRNQQGCCVVQRLLDAVDNRCKAEMIAMVLQVCNELVSDPYGNYIVQYVLDLNKEYICVQLASQFLKELRLLAANKYSSNVVEKCLATCPPDVRDLMILEMCIGDTAAALLQDEYGNYVVQTALKLATPAQFDLLRDAIEPYLATMGAEHVRKRIEARLKEGHTAPSSGTSGGNSPTQHGVCILATVSDPAVNFVATVPLDVLPEHLASYHGLPNSNGTTTTMTTKTSTTTEHEAVVVSS